MNLQGEVPTLGLEGGGPPSPRTAAVDLPGERKVDEDMVDDDGGGAED